MNLFFFVNQNEAKDSQKKKKKKKNYTDSRWVIVGGFAIYTDQSLKKKL